MKIYRAVVRARRPGSGNNRTFYMRNKDGSEHELVIDSMIEENDDLRSAYYDIVLRENSKRKEIGALKRQLLWAKSRLGAIDKLSIFGIGSK